MRLVVFSDSHRRVSTVTEIIERHKNNADLFIFLGDGNDDIDNALMLYPNTKIERVCGNCDFLSIYPASKVIDFQGKRIFFTHGHPYYVKHGYYDIEREARSVKADFCLFGHTHIPYIEHKDDIYFMNPGSCRDGIYGIIDIEPSGVMAYHTQV